MRKQLITLLFLSTFFIGRSQVIEKPVTSKIKTVTVFFDGAQIVRELSTSMNPGKAILKLKNLSPYIIAKSINVKSNPDCKLISVNHSKNFIDVLETSEEIKAINNQINSIELSIEDINNEIAILNEKELFLKSNATITGTNTPISVTDYKGLLEYYNAQMKEVKQSIFRYTKEIKKQKLDLEKLNAQKKELINTDNIASSELSISILCTKSSKINMEISYYVDSASWFPSYDVRVNNFNEPLLLNYKANIKQTTGVDWKDATVNLSNADPKIENHFKNMKTALVSFYQPVYEALMGRVSGVEINNSAGPGASPNIVIRGTSSLNSNNAPLYVVDGLAVNKIPNIQPDQIETISTLKRDDANALYGTRAANGVVIITTRAGAIINNLKTKELNIEYPIDAPVTISSDNTWTTFDIKNIDVKADYLYKCAPAYSTNVFAIAEINKWEDLNLLDGTTNVFYQQTYLGKSFISAKNASDSLDFDLGQEKFIVVERKENADYNENQIIGNKRVVTKSFQLKIRNNKEKDIKIELLEQIPISTDKQIQVEAIEISNGQFDEKTGILKWILNIAPGTTKILDVKYTIKYPKERAIEIQ